LDSNTQTSPKQLATVDKKGLNNPVFKESVANQFKILVTCITSKI